jgi:ATP-dependent exoDNAse (exonuclease V) beta subunit
MASAYRMTAMVPATSSQRRYRLPCFDIPPSLSLPPVECCLGTKPIHAARLRPDANACREDGTLIEGVVDLTFQEITPEFNGWTVVDFKTDLEIETARNQYLAQVAAYVDAVRVATASAARGFLLVI